MAPNRRRMLSWAAIDAAAVSLFLAIVAFVIVDSPLIGVLALGAAVALFSAFIFTWQGEPEVAPRPAAPEETESGLPVHAATGLSLWWVFRRRAAEEIARAQRQGRSLAIMLLEPGDLLANPSDEARATAARVLRRSLREGDVPAQLDDDRFVVMLPETDADGAKAAANRLLTGLREAEEPPMRWRAALVLYPKHGATPDELLDQAQMVLQPGRLESAMRDR